MVYCGRLKNEKCSYTKGVCILNNPKTKKDFKVCPASRVGKDYSEMSIQEKAFVNSIENRKEIELLSHKIETLHSRIEKYDIKISQINKNNHVNKRGWFKWLRK